jgi:hypothetical protein
MPVLFCTFLSFNVPVPVKRIESVILHLEYGPVNRFITIGIPVLDVIDITYKYFGSL